MRRTGTTRRGALTATGVLAAGAVLAGCGGDSATGGRGGAVSAAAVRAERTRRATAARTGAELLARYEDVATAHPATAAGLAPLRAAVGEHVKALLEGAGKAQSLSFVRTPPGTDARSALKELAAAERRAADAHTKALLTAEPELARLLASVAAACAAHAYLLTELAKETSS
ncbi:MULTISPECIES: hypothetical protein [unclassified Streptomyces]|uniref:hypothetical protein n=1 Tax=unclassified Streptomyces TaxID=2593676 RepID=UPI002DD90A91|nr:hypothetical protein [Streptomyces sp. NBC_01237]WRZ75480.1 hypothetical protein OG251_29850 [Streptomyces sp. NBC_01237]